MDRAAAEKYVKARGIKFPDIDVKMEKNKGNLFLSYDEHDPEVPVVLFVIFPADFIVNNPWVASKYYEYTPEHARLLSDMLKDIVIAGKDTFIEAVKIASRNRAKNKART